MNESWMKLIKECQGNGYTPREVQRILMFYEMTRDLDAKLKKLYEDEENECDD